MKFRHQGIPLKEVGGRLLELHKAIEEHDMAIGAEMDYHVDMVGTEQEQVRSVTLTVYFFEKTEKLEKSEAEKKTGGTPWHLR